LVNAFIHAWLYFTIKPNEVVAICYINLRRGAKEEGFYNNNKSCRKMPGSYFVSIGVLRKLNHIFLNEAIEVEKAGLEILR